MRPLKVILAACGPYSEKTQLDMTQLGTGGIYLITGEMCIRDRGSTAKIVTEVKSFVENYNAFASAVKEMGGSENTTYLEQMNELLSKDSDAYEKIGITFAEDGTLTLDEKALDGASVQDLKTAFYKDNDLEEIAQKSIRVQANAISGKYAATVSNYTDSGTYSNSALSSFLKSI